MHLDDNQVSTTASVNNTLEHLVTELDRLRHLVATMLPFGYASVASQPAEPIELAASSRRLESRADDQLDLLAQQLESVEAAAGVTNAYLGELATRVTAIRDAIRRNDERSLAGATGALRAASLMVGAAAMASWCDNPERTPPLVETEDLLASWLVRIAGELKVQDG